MALVFNLNNDANRTFIMGIGLNYAISMIMPKSSTLCEGPYFNGHTHETGAIIISNCNPAGCYSLAKIIAIISNEPDEARRYIEYRNRDMNLIVGPNDIKKFESEEGNVGYLIIPDKFFFPYWGTWPQSAVITLTLPIFDEFVVTVKISIFTYLKNDKFIYDILEMAQSITVCAFD